tara:strand:- start:7619 stop:7840 length:222 start_codon:yes stop_codon:yes gene_type:complete
VRIGVVREGMGDEVDEIIFMDGMHGVFCEGFVLIRVDGYRHWAYEDGQGGLEKHLQFAYLFFMARVYLVLLTC